MIILSLVGFWGYAQKFPVDTLSKTGPINRRINIVILGDGFTAAEMPKFIEEAKKFRNYFLSYAPYNRYADYFSFFAIKTPSNESGATNLGKSPDFDNTKGVYKDQPIETKDTYYGSAFGTANIHRLVFPTKYNNVTNVLANNFPSYDLIILIVNTPWYGGAGGALATYTLAASALNIAVHEVGHTFSALADEYWAGTQYAVEKFNLTKNSSTATIKWKNWLNRENVGIFEHTGTGAAGWYKPTSANCLMELLSKQNCAVCKETAVDKILKLIKPIESNSPNSSKTVFGSASQSFSIKLLKPNPNSLQVEWRIDGKLIESNKEQVSVSRSQLENKNATLTVSVFDTTGITQTESTRAGRTYTISWPLEKLDLPTGSTTVSASKTVLCAGESTTLTATGCRGTLAWSNGQTVASFSVMPIQTTTYTVNCMVDGVAIDEAKITVTVNPLPNATASNKGPYFERATIELASSGGTAYTWAGPNSFVSKDQNPTIPNATTANTGTYTVSVKNADGCETKATTDVKIDKLLSMDVISNEEVKLFPNPTKGRLQVQTTLGGATEIQLFDVLGRKVHSEVFKYQTEISTESLPKGMYLYNVLNNKRQKSGKIIIE